MRSILRVIVPLLLAGAPPAAAGQADAPTGTAGHTMVRLSALTTIQRQCAALALHAAMGEGLSISGWADCATVSQAVVGETGAEPFTLDELVRGITTGESTRIPVADGAAARDAVAYKLLALGYSARETADVVSGRITRQALDIAQRMILMGRGREAAADYLDREYTRLAAPREPVASPAGPSRRYATSDFDGLIDQYAQRHHVQPDLIRAIVATESGFEPAARSSAGAIGLMQLMPATARELGVNPHVPEQNLEGGVRYLSQLLKEFGRLDLALVAYNAGPGYAQRYARGGTALYGETRAYVRNVMHRLGYSA